MPPKEERHWNYRVMRHVVEDEVIHSIHEVYYDENGKVNGWTQEPIFVSSTEGIEGLRWQLVEMEKATSKPVLDCDTGFEIAGE